MKFLKTWNIFVLVLFIWQGITSLIFILGFGEVFGYFWGTHKWTGLALIIVLIVHLMFNWNWVASTYFKKPQQ